MLQVIEFNIGANIARREFCELSKLLFGEDVQFEFKKTSYLRDFLLSLMVKKILSKDKSDILMDLLNGDKLFALNIDERDYKKIFKDKVPKGRVRIRLCELPKLPESRGSVDQIFFQRVGNDRNFWCFKVQ